MKAIAVNNTQNGGKLEIQAFPVPVPGAGEILIKVHAAGVNRADILQKKGKYPPPAGASPILGLEVAGEVAATAGDVTKWQVGDKVCALLEGGGYAQYATAAAGQVLPIPAGFDYIQAASIPEAAFTVWSNLFDNAKLQKGEKLLVHGGASGIGVMAIQMAAAFGAQCFATAGSDEKCRYLEGLGAKRAINYKTHDFSVELGTGNINVILDIVGGSYFQKNIDLLAKRGRLVCIGFLQSAKAEVNFAQVLLKNLAIMGTTLRDKPIAEKAAIANKLEQLAWPWLESGWVIPVIDSVFPWEDVQKAHLRMETNANTGKIILKFC